jgi:hypothetical protein
MRLLDAITLYFQGEKIEALVFILPIGLLSLVFGGWLLSEGQGGFARGVAIPFILMGLVMSVVGGVVGYRTPSQVAALEAALTAPAAGSPATGSPAAGSPAAGSPALELERARMEEVNRAWSGYLVIWAAFGVIGLALRFGVRDDMWQGLGIALVFFSGVGLLVDGFAERRARVYAGVLSSGGDRP